MESDPIEPIEPGPASGTARERVESPDVSDSPAHRAEEQRS